MYENIEIDLLMLEITSACNLNCSHCYNNGNNRAPIHMKLGDIINVINEFKRYNTSRVVFTGGEPLIHPEIMEIINLASKYPDTIFEFTSNGTVITKDFISAVEEHNNIVIQLSIDGSNKDIYEKQRGINTYALFMEGFNLLSESSVRNKITRTAISNENYTDIENIYSLVIKKNMIPSFLFVEKMGNADNNWDKLSINPLRRMNVINQINRMNKKYGKKIPTPQPVSDCSFSIYGERKSFIVTSEGNVLACQWLYNQPIGNIFNESISQMLNGRVMQNLYERGASRYNVLKQSTICKECDVSNFCKFGCLGIAIDNEDPLGLDGACGYRRSYAICQCSNLL